MIAIFEIFACLCRKSHIQHCNLRNLCMPAQKISHPTLHAQKGKSHQIYTIVFIISQFSFVASITHAMWSTLEAAPLKGLADMRCFVMFYNYHIQKYTVLFSNLCFSHLIVLSCLSQVIEWLCLQCFATKVFDLGYVSVNQRWNCVFCEMHNRAPHDRLL